MEPAPHRTGGNGGCFRDEPSTQRGWREWCQQNARGQVPFKVDVGTRLGACSHLKCAALPIERVSELQLLEVVRSCVCRVGSRCPSRPMPSALSQSRCQHFTVTREGVGQKLQVHLVNYVPYLIAGSDSQVVIILIVLISQMCSYAAA